MFAPKRILVPTDFSEYSDKALRHAVDIARQYDAKVFLLHVIDEHIQRCAAGYCRTAEAVREMEQESTAQTTEQLQQEISRIVSEPADVKISRYVRRGIPYNEILQDQEEKNIDLIVMASHGRAGLVRYLIGSVAEKVMRGAKCPVLLVRG